MMKSRPIDTKVASTSSGQDGTKQALISVVQLWLDRLQHQAVVTTFFVSIDSLLFSLTSGTRSTDLSAWSKRDLVINAALGGAIIFHVCASIVAYFASFVLIRYRLDDAETNETTNPRPSQAERREPSASRHHSEKRSSHDTGKRSGRHSSHTHRPSTSIGSTLAPPDPDPSPSPIQSIMEFPMEVLTDVRSLVGIYRTHPLWFLGCCGRRKKQQDRSASDPEAQQPVEDAAKLLRGMVSVLSRAHTVCAAMTNLGFLLAILGILTYSWTAVPLALGIFASACLGGCAIAGVIALW